MRLLLMLVSGLVLMALPSQASQITAYACDTCNAQGAQVLARSYAPEPQCYFTNPPGTIATPDDMACSAPPRNLIVTNPLTQQAFKYRVQRQCYDTWCSNDVVLTTLSLTADEQEVMALYYDIDSSMRSAIGQMNEMIAMSIRGDFVSMTSTPGAQCSANPMDYFTNPSVRLQVKNSVKQKIINQVRHQPWSEYITTSYMGPTGFRFGVRTADVSFSQRHITQPAYERYFFGDTSEERNRNNLNFRVDYVGRISDQPGVTSWGLRLSVDRSTSYVDGHTIGGLTPGGGTVNLTGSQADMPCFNEFIENQSGEIVSPVGPDSGGSGGAPTPPGSGGDSGGGSCRSTTSATVCSTTSDGAQTCSTTVYHFLTVC